MTASPVMRHELSPTRHRGAVPATLLEPQVRKQQSAEFAPDPDAAPSGRLEVRSKWKCRRESLGSGPAPPRHTSSDGHIFAHLGEVTLPEAGAEDGAQFEYLSAPDGISKSGVHRGRVRFLTQGLCGFIEQGHINHKSRTSHTYSIHPWCSALKLFPRQIERPVARPHDGVIFHEAADVPSSDAVEACSA